MRRETVVLLLLAAAGLAVFLPLADSDFINFDDNEYVYENPRVTSGLTGGNVWWALASTEMGNWHPLTWMSHQLDSGLFGLRPGRHHMVSVGLHVVNSILLFLLWHLMTGAFWPSSLAAILFALHPLHVESVAWISERKDVLSTFFWLLTTLAYIASLRRPSPRRRTLVILLFALGLMSKPMLVTLPLTLLLLDFWPLGLVARPNPREHRQGRLVKRLQELAVEKAPLFLMALASSAVTFAVQKSAGAVVSVREFPLAVRAANALIAYTAYLVKTAWPTSLGIFYPVPVKAAVWQASGSALALGVLTVAALAMARRRPYLLIGWFWYLLTLVPVIGLVQVGRQAMADRYTYVPLIGVFVAVAWLGADLAAGKPRALRIVIPLAMAGGIALSALTMRQVSYWRNSVTVFERAVEVNPVNPLAQVNLGMALKTAGRAVQAIEHYRLALAQDPYDPLPYNNLAWIRATHPDPGLRDGREAVNLATVACGATGYANPLFLDTLAASYAEAGRFDEAVDTAARAAAFASAEGMAAAARIEEHLALFRAATPFREPDDNRATTPDR